jgi:ribonuclease HII
VGDRGPGLTRETEFIERGLVVAGVDEVGRGAVAGPLFVGAVVPTLSNPPEGLDDSKRLTDRSRRHLVPLIENWARSVAVGAASSGEIDEFGLVAALGMAARRAVSALDCRVDAILLDGSHDFIHRREKDQGPDLGDDGGTPLVTTVVRGDRQCASIAAASVIAKVLRDDEMVRLSRSPEGEGYGWSSNKGYLSAFHSSALRERGPSRWHRVSWQLPDFSPS